ncbi:hypothetical protein PTD2_04766 [Pseudoalteromonas tunicata D2]|uniref:Uncharacterized protein n=1 Tax=Pseudoalteromonas tunicata D2 TaxID=87626 RepID=A4CFP3_9GAMM|nr:hypothetical protein PTD2_04766 [Pseudoalteromonas tunicata D2]
MLFLKSNNVVLKLNWLLQNLFFKAELK